MQDRTAIEKIAEMAQPFSAVASDVPAIVLQGGNKLESIEGLMNNPLRFVSTFRCSFIEQFIQYGNNNSTKNGVTYIDIENSKAISIFDHGTPESPAWGHHKAILNLKRNPAYEKLLALNECHITQLDLIEFLTDWSHRVEFTHGLFVDAINCIRRVTINKSSTTDETIEDFKSTASAMEKIEMSSGERPLPEGFLFKVIPYRGFREYDFYCRIKAHPTDPNWPLSFRISELDSIKLSIGEEFQEKITSNIVDMKAYIGTVDHR